MKAFIALSALLALASADQSSHQTIQHGHAAPYQPAADPSDVHNPYHADHKPITAVHAPAHVPVHAPYQPAPYRQLKFVQKALTPYHPSSCSLSPSSSPLLTRQAPYTQLLITQLLLSTSPSSQYHHPAS
ncbi:unnamed protein product [Lepeophtheirus salmonis]|uniref:(salmon louse) hypothetical protein n=1 Tax=Lepeophtheirus salmonis TaxID=72036 RepID=A0A817FCL4_LEPSM|nr:unnamed protein product [Lepeophtheirus salmonis]CAG9477638.1 unnamed protein product [Lepeophtheirus salmonis]